MVVAPTQRILEGEGNDTPPALFNTSNESGKKQGSFSEWFEKAKKEINRLGHLHVPDEVLFAKAEGLCLDARRRAGLQIPADFQRFSSPGSKLVARATDSVVRWKGVSTRWCTKVFAESPEIQSLRDDWDCPMWFIRNYCVVVMLRLRGVSAKGGSVVDNIDKFSSAAVRNGADDSEVTCSETDIVFISYTGDRSVRDFLEHLQDPKLKDAYIWCDVFCVDQDEWKQRHDKEMAAFKRQFMFDLKTWISKVGSVALLLDRWDDVTTTLGKIWVIWEIYSCTRGEATLTISFLKKEGKRFLVEGIGSAVGFHRVFASLAKVDARQAKSFVEEEKTLILDLLQSESNGIHDVNSQVAEQLRKWLLETGLAMCEAAEEEGNYWKTVLGNNLAIMCSDMGIYNEAQRLLQRNLASQQTRYQHVLSANSVVTIQNMAILLRSQGKLEEAKSLFKHALEGQRHLLGNEHPETMTSINNMAVLLYRQGKLVEAQTLCDEALERRRELLSDKHQETLNSVNDKAILLTAQGKLEEAKHLHEEALNGRRVLLGCKHPCTLASLNNMANFSRVQGKMEEAEHFYRVGLEGRRELLGNSHPDTLATIINHASFCAQVANGEEALRLCKEGKEGCLRVLGQDHPYTKSANKLWRSLEPPKAMVDADEEGKNMLCESPKKDLSLQHGQGVYDDGTTCAFRSEESDETEEGKTTGDASSMDDILIWGTSLEPIPLTLGNQRVDRTSLSQFRSSAKRIFPKLVALSLLLLKTMISPLFRMTRFKMINALRTGTGPLGWSLSLFSWLACFEHSERDKEGDHVQDAPGCCRTTHPDSTQLL